MSDLPDNDKTLQEQCYGTCWGAEQRIMELEYHIHKLVARLEAAEGMREALNKIQNMDYRRSAVNGCAYDAHTIATQALAAFDAAGKEGA